jgi:AcrR family transcriptional regulator
MTDDRGRDRSDRRRLITATARALAEREGWDAVTTRRLSTEIGYSQPVIYKHFLSLDELVESVALEGFGELAELLAAARTSAAPQDGIRAVAAAYDDFALRSPALYDAMFARATRLRFAAPDPPPALSAAYAELRAAVGGRHDPDTRTEVFWAALHGLATLDRDHRLRRDHRAARLDLLVEQFREPS